MHRIDEFRTMPNTKHGNATRGNHIADSRQWGAAWPGQRDKIRQLGYILYADDITFWATEGSFEEEQTLQRAANAVAGFAP